MAVSNLGERNVGDYTKSLPQQGSGMATFCSKNIVQACKENSTSVFTANLSQYLRELKGWSQQVYKDTLIQIKDTAPFKRNPEHQQLLRDAGIEQSSILGHSLSLSNPNPDLASFHQFQQPQQQQPNYYSYQISPVTASQRAPQTEAENYPVWPNDRDAVLKSFRDELVPLSSKFDADEFPEELALGISQNCFGDLVGAKETQINTMRNALKYLGEKNSALFEFAWPVVRNCAKYKVLLEEFRSQDAASYSVVTQSQPQTTSPPTDCAGSITLKALNNINDYELYGDGYEDAETEVDMHTAPHLRAEHNKVCPSEDFHSITPWMVRGVTINDLLPDELPKRTLEQDIKMCEQELVGRYRRVNYFAPYELQPKKIIKGKVYSYSVDRINMSVGDFYLDMLKLIEKKDQSPCPIGTLRVIVQGNEISQAAKLKFLANQGQFDLGSHSTVFLSEIKSCGMNGSLEGTPCIEVLQYLPSLLIRSDKDNPNIPLLPQNFNTYVEIDRMVYLLFKQSKGEAFDVGVAEYLEFYIAIKKATIELRECPIRGPEGEFISQYFDLVLGLIKLYKPAFVGRQNQYLDPYISLLAGHSSQRHKEMTVDALIAAFELACDKHDEDSKASSLLMLLQGLKYNLLTKDQANKLLVHPHFPDNLRNPLSEQIAAGKLKYSLSDALANKSASKLDEVDETSNSTAPDLEEQLNITDEQLHSMYSEHAPFGQLFYSIQPGYVTRPIPKSKAKPPSSLK